MSRWSDLYKSRSNESYFNYFKEKYRPFIEYILSVSDHKRKDFSFIHEDACGAGNLTLALNEKLSNKKILSASDIDPEMLALSSAAIFRSHKGIKLFLHDMKEEHDDVYDLIVSHGSLEHFSDGEVRDIIKTQLLCADHVIHYVPGDRYEKPSYGDERLMLVERWIDIITPYNIEIFNDGFDYILHYKN